MGMNGWLRVLDAVTGLAQMAGRFRRAAGESQPSPDAPLTVSPDARPGQLEARLAGVLVAALKEAFDRDRARLDLEQAQVDAERQRAEAALKAELRRQEADRALHSLRLVAIMALGVWMLSAALAVWLPGLRAGLPRVFLGLGWALAIAALGGAFAGSQRVAAWAAPDTSGASSGAAAPGHTAASAAPWLLVGSLALTGAGLLAAL
jgi:hypothetical protein